jgi:hypothetical protein
MDDFAALKPYLDDEGRLTTWPSARNRKAVQTLVLRYLAEKFEFGRDYSEREVNDLLNRWHTFGDPALLRRELFENGYVNREKSGARYWRTKVKFL